MNLINSFLMIYVWAAVCFLVFFLFAIARFYESKSGRRSFYRAYLFSIILFFLATLWTLFLPFPLLGNLWTNIFYMVGGLILGVSALFLFNLMMGGRS